MFPHCQVQGAFVPAIQVGHGAKVSYRHEASILHLAILIVHSVCLERGGFCRVDPEMIDDLNKKAVSPLSVFHASVKSGFILRKGAVELSWDI